MLKYRKNINTQFGEDGIIEYLFEKLNIKNGGTCCEFGAWDGKHLSNTFRLIKTRNFKGLYIEGDPEKYKDLLKTCEEYPNIIPVNAMVTNNLDDIFEANNFPYDVDIMSIDVDSIDYEIWRDAVKCNAKVVIIEADNSVPSWIKKPIYDPTKGANYFILEELGKKKGYTLVCNTSNMFFVRNDLMVDTIEIDDSLFPWHLEPELKYIIINSCFNKVLLPDITKYVTAEQKNDFIIECQKYCNGIRLGFIDHTVISYE